MNYPEPVKVLCVDDEKNVLKALRRVFMDDDYEILTASSGEEGLQVLEEEMPVQVVISDYRMPGMNGVDFLREVCERWPDTVRIVLSGYADTASVVAAINEGQIYKFVPKPWNDDELRVTVSNALEKYFLQKENTRLTEELKEKNRELTLLNENLERLVEERTEELRFRNLILERGQKILDTLPVGVVGIDTEGFIVAANSEAVRFFSSLGRGGLGDRIEDAFPEELLDFVARLDEEEKIHRYTSEGKACEIRGKKMTFPEGQEGKVLVIIREVEGV
ncbi:MAG: response regulator [Deltaproteobacteria bacterium]|nr:MAG: response regulator [Deltaproteobacteria bacterium]